jgi:hypothetical protein
LDLTDEQLNTEVVIYSKSNDEFIPANFNVSSGNVDEHYPVLNISE